LGKSSAILLFNLISQKGSTVMFETRSLFYKAEKVIEAANQMQGKCPHIGFLQRLYQ
jgi:hypothetical protein